MRTTLCILVLAACLIANAPAAAPPTRPVDAYGDPLPHAATARLGTTRWRTGGSTFHLAYSPDGKLIAAADGAHQRVMLFDSTTGKVVRTLWGHHGSAKVLAFSPDGKRLLSADDKMARIWDVATGEQIRKIVLPDPVRQATFIAGGKELLILDNTNRIVRFDVAGKELARTRSGCTSSSMADSAHG